MPCGEPLPVWKDPLPLRWLLLCAVEASESQISQINLHWEDSMSGKLDSTEHYHFALSLYSDLYSVICMYFFSVLLFILTSWLITDTVTRMYHFMLQWTKEWHVLWFMQCMSSCPCGCLGAAENLVARTGLAFSLFHFPTEKPRPDLMYRSLAVEKCCDENTISAAKLNTTPCQIYMWKLTNVHVVQVNLQPEQDRTVSVDLWVLFLFF